MNKKVLWGIVAVIVLVLIIAFAFSREAVEEYESLVEEENAVVVADQQPDEEEITVHYAKLAQPGYVVIYSTGATGEKGEILGTSDYLEAGEHTNVKVRRRGGSGIPGSTFSANQQIVAQIAADDGDGEYGEEDSVVTDESGEEVSSEATIDESAEEVTVEDIADLLEEEGYSVNEEVIDEFEDDFMMEAPSEGEMMDHDSMMSDDATTTDDSMMNDGSSMEMEVEMEVQGN